MTEREVTVRADLLKFKETPPIVGLSGQVVADLWDILDKRGRIDPDRGMVEFLFSGSGKSLIVSKAPQGTAILVLKNRNVTAEDMVKIDTNTIGIGWDKRVTAQYAKSAIALIDQQLRAAGQIDERGQRKRLTPEESLKPKGEKLNTREIFTDENVAYATMAPSPEAALRRFDHPERLEVISFLQGQAILRLKPAPLPKMSLEAAAVMFSHLDLFHLRDKGATEYDIRTANIVMMQEILKRGHTIWTFDALSEEEHLAILTQVVQALAELWGDEKLFRVFKFDHNPDT